MRDSVACNGVLGWNGVGSCSDNGRFLLEFCTECQLAITNTIFQRNYRLDATTVNTLASHVYVLARQRGQIDVLHMSIMPGAECCTDHGNVRCNLKVQYNPKLTKKVNSVKWLNVVNLCQEDVPIEKCISIEKILSTKRNMSLKMSTRKKDSGGVI